MRMVAIICSYGHQDFYRVLGRDPVKEPMTTLERDVFARLLLEVWEAKVAVQMPASVMGGATGDGDG